MRGTKPIIREDPEAVTDISPPAWLSPDARAEWSRVIPILTDRKILSAADLGSLENYCVAIGTVREMDRYLQEKGHIIDVEGVPRRNPAVGIQAEAMTRSLRLAAELGLTPVSRSRPTIRDDNDANPLLDLWDD